MARHPHLYRRQAVYWWRRRIPKNLRPFCQVVELRVTLRTYIAEEAVTRAARLRVVTDLAFQHLERAVTTGLTLPDQTFDQLVTQLVQDELDRCERERELAGPRTEADIQQAVLDHQRRRAHLQQALRYNAYEELEQQLAPAIAAVQGVATDRDLAVLRRRAAKGLLRATHLNELYEQGIYAFEESGRLPLVAADTVSTYRAVADAGVRSAMGAGGQPTQGVSPRCVPQQASRPTGKNNETNAARQPTNVVSMRGPGPRPKKVDVDLNEYLNGTALDAKAIEKLKTLPIVELSNFYTEMEATEDMKRKFHVVIRLLKDVSGNVPVTQVTRPQIIKAVTLMLRMPKTHGKGPETRKPLQDLIAWADAKDERKVLEIEGRLARGEIDRKTAEDEKQREVMPRVKPGHVLKNHLPRLNAFFEWCYDHGLIPEPLQINAKSISRRARLAAAEQDKSVQRLPWGPDGLSRFFETSVFTAPRQRHDDPLFWGPLIAVHQGTREEEVLQLRVSDFVQEEGIWVIKLREGYVKNQKTPASTRTLPVHQFLIDLGLIELVQARRNAEGNDAWVFGGIDLGHDKKFSSVFSKKFTRYRQQENVYTESCDFHSFRKDFNSMLARAGVEWSSRKRLMGHVIRDLTEGTYDPCGEPMAVRREYINRIDLGFAVAWHDGYPVLTKATSS